MENTTADEGKTIAIIAYITLIGFIIAIVMNSSKKSEFASFHIRQMLGLMLLSLTISILSYVLPLGIVYTILSIFVLILWVLGFVGAIQGEKKLIPVLGAQFQDWFKNIN